MPSTHTPHTGRESSHKGTCHPHHVCVCEAEEWAVDEHSGLVKCGVWWLEKRDGVVVGGGKSTERGECGWWMKRGMV